MRGQMLGHYRILEWLGAGGMGEVYLAEDSQLKRRVALKVLSPEFATDAERLERFQLEAEAVAALNHPNIVTVFSVEEAGAASGAATRFLTMELVEGKRLDEVIPDAGLPLRDFFRLAGQLLEGVAAAHAKGVIHRDLKPPNVMVTGDGRVKILDFGLAKLWGSGRRASGDSDLPTALMTGQGVVLSTPAYMAPEQAAGARVDARADVFALGAVLYEMLTGSRPFQGESVAAVQAAVLTSDPRPPRALRPDLPAPLDGLVMRCLRKNPAERFASAGEVATELARQSAPGQPARGHGRGDRRCLFDGPGGRLQSLPAHRSAGVPDRSHRSHERCLSGVRGGRRIPRARALAGALPAWRGVGHLGGGDGRVPGCDSAHGTAHLGARPAAGRE